MSKVPLEFHLGHLGPLNFYLMIQKFSSELRSLFWYRIYYQTMLDALIVNIYENLLMKLDIKRFPRFPRFRKSPIAKTKTRKTRKKFNFTKQEALSLFTYFSTVK